MSTVISVEQVSKSYRLGQIGGGTLKEDFARWCAKLQGKPDPSLKIGQEHHARLMGQEFWALQDVNFEVKEGEVLGIIGRNGAGKSTLLKILSQVTTPTSGQIKIKGRIASLLEVGTGFHPELTGRENIFLNGAILGMTKTEIRKKFDEIVAFSGVEEFIDTPVKRYSSGMYVRLAFAVAAHLEPEILIVDEVLAVGDAEFQKKCIGKMQDVAGHGRTILFVSHNTNAVQRLCPRVILLKDGKVQQIGLTNAVLSNYLTSTKSAQRSRVDLTKIDLPRSGSGKVRFTSFAMRNSKGELAFEIAAGERFSIEFTINSSLNVKTLLYGFSFVSSDGVELIGTTAHDSGMPTLFERGNYTFRCYIEPNALLPGKYTIRGAIFTPSESFDHLEEIITFQVADFVAVTGAVPSSHRVGYFYLPFKWEQL